jgi:hypothetical protein
MTKSTALGYLQLFCRISEYSQHTDVRTSGKEPAKKDVVLFTILPDLVSRFAFPTRLMGRKWIKVALRVWEGTRGERSGGPCQTFSLVSCGLWLVALYCGSHAPGLHKGGRRRNSHHLCLVVLASY